MLPTSCDTFVVLPSATANRQMIFGKNSDRPAGEVQEVVFIPRTKVAAQQKCTYISIAGPTSGETNAVVLSKPAWMWGAEMGANEFGLVVGNEAVWTKMADAREDLVGKLLGMDLLRLSLERAKTAGEALDVITQLLGKYGQGGACSETLKEFSYHNSFLLVDPNDAWVLETAGREWVAQQVTTAYRNISNCLSIGTDFDRSSATLKQTAQAKGLWSEGEEFDFAKVYSDGMGHNDHQRYQNGKTLLAEATAAGNFDVGDMMKILRDETSGICRGCDDAFPSMASQVSSLSAEPKARASCHWFTATPDPKHSYFKPIIFHACLKQASAKTISSSCPPREHELYQAHQKVYGQLCAPNSALHATLSNLESTCIVELNTLLAKGQDDLPIDGIETLFDDSVESELRFYR